MNRRRATELMEEHRLDALVATTPENFLYVTDFFGVFLPGKSRRWRFMAVVPRDESQPLGMLCPRVKMVYGAQVELPVDDIRAFGVGHPRIVDPERELTAEDEKLLELERNAEQEPDAFAVLRGLLADRGLARDARIGVDEMGLSHGDWEALGSYLPGAELVDAYDIFRDVRAIKTPEEVERLREGLARTHEAVAEVVEQVEVGVRQGDLWEAFRAAMYGRGLTPRSISIGVGHSSAYSFTEPLDYRARPGDLIKLDPNALWRGYLSDTGRTGVIGEPSSKQERCFAALTEGFDAGVAALRPGVPAGEVFDVIRDTTRAAGIPHYEPHALGHSIGLEIYDEPAIGDGETRPLEAGMVVNIEVPYYEIGFGGIQIEDTYLITDTGAEPLGTYGRELFSVG